jgi:hypothetical protein
VQMRLVITLILGVFASPVFGTISVTAQTTTPEATTYQLTVTVIPAAPKEIVVKADKTYSSNASIEAYNVNLPANAGRLSVVVRWPPTEEVKVECQRQLKLLRAKDAGQSPKIGISCIPFHLDLGRKGIDDIASINTDQPRYFDRYLTAKSSVLYYFDNPVSRKKTFGTRVLDALGIWYNEASKLIVDQEDRPFNLEYDVELARVIEWVLGNPQFTESDLRNHACLGQEALAACREGLTNYSKSKPK